MPENENPRRIVGVDGSPIPKKKTFRERWSAMSVRVRVLLVTVAAIVATVAAFVGNISKIKNAFETATEQGEKVAVATSNAANIEVTAVRVKHGICDIITRNKGTVASVIHKAEFEVVDVQPERETDVYSMLPSTYQYHLLITPWKDRFELDVAQEVLPGRADRFQIVLAMARMALDENRESELGYSLLFPPQFPDTEDNVKKADFVMKLHLTVDGGHVITTEPFKMTLYPLGFGYRAKRIVGFSLEEKVELLSDSDINIVESVISVLQRIGGTDVLSELTEFRKRNHQYLEQYYRDNFYKGRTQACPSPEQRMSDFYASLDEVIASLQEESESQ